MPRFNTPIEFYFDFVSPFGYFASLRVDDLAARHGRSVDWYAIRLGVSVVKVMGLKPLLETPLKGAYLAREAGRCAQLHGLTLKRPLDAPRIVRNRLRAAVAQPNRSGANASERR